LLVDILHCQGVHIRHGCAECNRYRVMEWGTRKPSD